MKRIWDCLRIILIVIIIINIYGIHNTKCYAVKDEPVQDAFGDDFGGGASVDVTQNPSYWDPRNSGSSDSTFESKISGILGAVQMIGIIVSVGTLAIIGIKFMLGSVDEKAQYKQALIPWLIGAIMVFAMTSLPKLIYNFTKGTI